MEKLCQNRGERAEARCCRHRQEGTWVELMETKTLYSRFSGRSSYSAGLDCTLHNTIYRDQKFPHKEVKTAARLESIYETFCVSLTTFVKQFISSFSIFIVLTYCTFHLRFIQTLLKNICVSWAVCFEFVTIVNWNMFFFFKFQWYCCHTPKFYWDIPVCILGLQPTIISSIN